jgi:hypothetical protein
MSDNVMQVTQRQACWLYTWKAPVNVHRSWFVFNWGMTTDITGMVGLYLASNLYKYTKKKHVINYTSARYENRNGIEHNSHFSLIWEVIVIGDKMKPCSPSRWGEANDNRSLNLDSCSNLYVSVKTSLLPYIVPWASERFFSNETKKCTAEEAIDSMWLIGSPTYLTVFLKYKSWL